MAKRDYTPKRPQKPLVDVAELMARPTVIPSRLSYQVPDLRPRRARSLRAQPQEQPLATADPAVCVQVKAEATAILAAIRREIAEHERRYHSS